MYCYQCDGKVKVVRGVQKCEGAGCDKWAMIGTRFCERCSRDKDICQRCGVSMGVARKRKEDVEKEELLASFRYAGGLINDLKQRVQEERMNGRFESAEYLEETLKGMEERQVRRREVLLQKGLLTEAENNE